jgi:hypothetical protein
MQAPQIAGSFVRVLTAAWARLRSGFSSFDPGRRRLVPGLSVRMRWWVVAAGVLGAAAAICVVLVPAAIGRDTASPSPIPNACQLQSPQPESPLQLNAVAVKKLAKTIAMKKEVFSCFDAQSKLAQIRDQETFIELVDRSAEKGKAGSGKAERGHGGKPPSVTTVAARIESVTCVKDLVSGRVGCRSEPVQLGTTNTPLARCTTTTGTYPFDPITQPSHPVEMSTVVLANGLVKTIKVENEVFSCSGQIGDLYLFTEIVERAKESTIMPLARQFAGVMCFKDEAKAQVVACKLFTPGRA